MGAFEAVGNLRRRWTRRAGRMAASGLCLAGAVVAISPAAGASGPPKYSVAYYDLHPCSLITSGQVKSVFGMAVGPGRTILPHVDGGPGGGKCEYGTLNEDHTLTYSFELVRQRPRRPFFLGLLRTNRGWSWRLLRGQRF